VSRFPPYAFRAAPGGRLETESNGAEGRPDGAVRLRAVAAGRVASSRCSSCPSSPGSRDSRSGGPDTQIRDAARVIAQSNTASFDKGGRSSSVRP